jgi:hypothetical protein
VRESLGESQLGEIPGKLVAWGGSKLLGESLEQLLPLPTRPLTKVCASRTSERYPSIELLGERVALQVTGRAPSFAMNSDSPHSFNLYNGSQSQ